ncbi:MurR/RpiR family transcriptional regulator [Enterococcus sp. ALS3]|uniref:MurR/RpiR family transcriptional regulator n=1 Tax=Enterococcus alishanensis TaxID=1303817 RepID=A0ABS6TGY9_9ENTE|nr:MurR/RpiR family transcriptional regulator [Enterococcus alishanensis]MBV7392107.1 MurR/RpiR family transcriptional regulator [Enterococcus alishanensis]
MNFDQHIKINFEKLSKNEQEMIYYILNHKTEVITLSINELGNKLLSSKSSVLRLAKKIGFRGFSEMKYSIEQSLLQTTIAPTDLVATLQKEIDQTFQYASQTNFQPLLDKIKQANQLYLYATGFTQNNYTKDFSNDLFLSGRPNYLISGETNFEMISQTLTADDLVIVTSLSGNTPAIKNAIKNLQLIKVPICSVTFFGKNFLSDAADYQLYYETSELPSLMVTGSYSMVGLNIILTILARKFREYILFDE